MTEIKKNVVFEAFPKQQQFIDAVMSGLYKYLTYGGAIRGGKTFVAIAVAILLCRIFPRSRWTIVRKDLKRLRDNTRPSLDKFLEGSGWKIKEPGEFTSPEGSKLLFMGENFDKDKTLERFKGHETNGFILEEVSEIREATFYKCMERAGSYIITPEPKAGQPPPLIIMTCNPTQSWIKNLVYDPWKAGKLPKDMFYLPAFADDNPHLSEEYRESLRNLPTYEYEVFVKGNWDITLKTPNAFWHAIDVNKHVKPVFYDDKSTVHVSIDANTMPYCTATFWQIFPDRKLVQQFGEVIARPRRKDDQNSIDRNHAGGLGVLVSEFLHSIDYTDVLFVYGDATTKNQNAIDEKKRSFFDIFLESVKENFKVQDRIGRNNPQVVKTGEFVNAIYAGYDSWQIEISETCKESLSDYLTVKTDMDGTMQKKKVTDDDGNSYEEFGHCSDTKRYFFYEAMPEIFAEWDDRFSDPSPPIVEVIEHDPFDEV